MAGKRHLERTRERCLLTRYLAYCVELWCRDVGGSKSFVHGMAFYDDGWGWFSNPYPINDYGPFYVDFSVRSNILSAVLELWYSIEDIVRIYAGFLRPFL